MNTIFYQVVNNARGTIQNNPLSSGGTNLVVSNDIELKLAGLTFPYNLTLWEAILEPNTDPNMEVVTVTARPSANNYTIVRGQEGTIGVTHAYNDNVGLLWTSALEQQITASVNDLETFRDVTLPYNIQKQSYIYAIDSGIADIYTIAVSPAIVSYSAGQVFVFKAGNNNTGTSSLNVNGLGSITIKKQVSINLIANDILGGQIITVMYDGTNFQIISILGNAGGGTPAGSDTQVQFNDGGSSFGADLNFTWDNINKILYVGSDGVDGAFKSPDATTNDDAPNLLIGAGNSFSTGQAGQVGLAAGNGGTTSDGGSVYINGGTGGSSSGDGGDIQLRPGLANTGSNGLISFIDPSSGNWVDWITSSMTGVISLTIPNNSGTIALLSDISSETPYAEIPSGTVGGNVTFTLANTPTNGNGVIVLLDGVTQYNGIDYTVSGNIITFSVAPIAGSTIFAYYSILSGGVVATTYKNGVSSYSGSTGSQTIAHGLGRIPKKLKISASSNNLTSSQEHSIGTYNGITTSTVWSDDFQANGTDSTYVIYISDSIDVTLAVATATVDSTNINLSWTITGSAAQVDFIWEVEG